MFVDWFTFIAQIVNFIILVWLLKRFLYGPIILAIDEREKKISGQFVEAAAKTEAAVREREEFQRKNEDFDRRRESLLAGAVDEAENRRRRMLDEARAESDQLRARLRETLEKERSDLTRDITRRIRLEVFAAARGALADLADEGLEGRMLEVFVKRLRGFCGDDKERLAAALGSSARAVSVRSAFKLSATQCAGIELAVKETFAADIRIEYETEPDLVGGIELTANGYRFAWSIADYLSSLEKSVDAFFSEKIKSGMKTDEHSG